MSHAHSVTGRPACCRQRPFAPAAPLLPYPDSNPSAGPRGRASRPGTCSCSCISTRSRPLTISVMPCSTWRRRAQAPEAGQTLPDAACRECQRSKPHSNAEVLPHGVHALWASPVNCSADCVPLHKAAPCNGRDQMTRPGTCFLLSQQRPPHRAGSGASHVGAHQPGRGRAGGASRARAARKPKQGASAAPEPARWTTERAGLPRATPAGPSRTPRQG